MKYLFALLALSFSWLPSANLRAAPFQPGQIAYRSSGNYNRVLADPARDRFYAINSSSNAVSVFGTAPLALLATIAVGSVPVDMAIAPEGTKLYVANSGSNLTAVSVVDLETLTQVGTFSLPGAAVAIAVGPAEHVYVTALSDSTYSTYQLDGATGVVQVPFATNTGKLQRLAITPDGSRVFALNVTSGTSFYTTSTASASLLAFDTTTQPPTLLQTTDFTKQNPLQLVVSPTGRYLCAPNFSGFTGTGYDTALYSTADISRYYGTLAASQSSGLVAFGPGDSLVYQLGSGGQTVDAFDTGTFTKTESVALANPYIALANPYSYAFYGADVDFSADRTGSYFAKCQTGGGSLSSGNFTVFITGHGPLTTASILPSIVASYLENPPIVGRPFIYQITAANAPTGFQATGLPPGLNLDPITGLITGVPTTSDEFYATVTASNASGADQQSLDLNVSPSISTTHALPAVTVFSLPRAVTTHPYQAAFAATNGPTLFTASNLPPGLVIDDATGVISGTPTAPGAYSVSLSATTEDNESAGATLSLYVDEIPTEQPTIVSPSTAVGVLHESFNYQVTATNAPSAFAATGLPAGLTIATATGVISGTPRQIGTFAVTLSAINAYGTSNKTLDLQILAAHLPEFTSAAEIDANGGTAFTYTLTATNNPTIYAATGLPPGLSLSSKGVISGVPTEAGVFNVALSATNVGGTGTQKLRITVAFHLSTVSISNGGPASYQDGMNGHAIIHRTGNSAGNIMVRYTLKGSAANGVDYVLRSGKVKIKAGSQSVSLPIIPLEPMPTKAKKVRLILQPGQGYMVGTPNRTTIRILPYLPPGDGTTTGSGGTLGGTLGGG